MTDLQTLSSNLDSQINKVGRMVEPIVITQVTPPRQTDFEDKWLELGNKLPILPNIKFLWNDGTRFRARYATFNDNAASLEGNALKDGEQYTGNPIYNQIDKFLFKRQEYIQWGGTFFVYSYNDDRTKIVHIDGNLSFKIYDSLTDELYHSVSLAALTGGYAHLAAYTNSLVYFFRHESSGAPDYNSLPSFRSINEDGTGETEIYQHDINLFTGETAKLGSISLEYSFYNPDDNCIYMAVLYEELQTSEPATYNDVLQIEKYCITGGVRTLLSSSHSGGPSTVKAINVNGIWVDGGYWDLSMTAFTVSNYFCSGYVHKITTDFHQKQDFELIYSLDLNKGDAAASSWTIGESVSVKKIRAGYDDIPTINFSSPAWPDTTPPSAGIPRIGVGNATITTTDTSNDFSTILFSVPRVKHYHFKLNFTCAVNVNLYVNNRLIASNVPTGTYEGFIPRQAIVGEADNIKFDFEVVTPGNAVTFQSLELFDNTFDEYDSIKISGTSGIAAGVGVVLLQINTDATVGNYHSQTLGTLSNIPSTTSTAGFLEYTTYSGMHLGWPVSSGGNAGWEGFLIDIHREKRHSYLGEITYIYSLTSSPSGQQRYQLRTSSVNKTVQRVKTLKIKGDVANNFTNHFAFQIYGLRGDTTYGL